MERVRLMDRRWAIILKLAVLLAADCVFLALNQEEGALALAILLAALVVWSALNILRSADVPTRQKYGDFAVIFLVLILVWGCGVQYGNLDAVMFPSPMHIMSEMVIEFPRYLDNLAFSLGLLAKGFLLAFAVGFPLGLLLSCNRRVRLACSSYIKILSLLPSLALLPYAVAVMGFRYASVSILFYAMFWNILQGTMRGALNFDKDYILTARLLRISRSRYVLRVLIPGIMPSVLASVSGCISGGFVVLIASEMIGSSRGLGYFIKYFAMFINYPKIMVGIIYLGITVCVVVWLFEKVQAAILSWQVNERKRSFEFLRKVRPAE